MTKEKQVNSEQTQEVIGAQMTAEQEAQAQAELLKEYNLRFYTEGCDVPKDALKPIKAGRLKGMSDVNPMWRMKRMTEIFGPVGFGWKYEIVRQWTETYGNEVKCFCNVHLFVRDPETKEWSAPIPGSGGSAIVSVENKGTTVYVNDEGYKMALTDALSIAMKPLGIGGNIWYGPKATGHNESKYESYTQEGQTQQSGQAQGAAAVAFTGIQLNHAIQEMNAATTEEQFKAIWDKWAKAAPAMVQQGTEFYNVACHKINAIKNPSAQ